MSKTIKQLCNQLNLKRTSIEMRMNEIPKFRNRYTHRVSGRIIINDDGCKKIAKLHGGVKKDAAHKSTTSNDSAVDNDTLVKTKMLKDMLNRTQKQLDNANSSNKHLGKLLDQQQQLQIATQHENVQLKGQIRHLKTIPGHVEKSRDKSTNSVRKKKLSFWQRLFSKH